MLAAVLALALAQAPAAAAPRVLLLLPAPRTTGLPAAVVRFAEEHVRQELEARGLDVVPGRTLAERLGAAGARELLACDRRRADCSQALAQASGTEGVVEVGLGRLKRGIYPVQVTARATDGRVLAEYQEAVRSEAELLDGLTRAAGTVVPPVREALRPTPPPPPPPPALEPPSPPGMAPAPAAPAQVQPVRRRPLRRWAWAPALGGLVAGGLGLSYLQDARSDHRELTREPLPGEEPLSDAQARRLARDGRVSQRLGWAGMGLAAAGLGGGVLFYVLGDAPAQPALTATGTGGWTVGVAGVLP